MNTVAAAAQRTILLVDDDPYIRGILDTYLTGKGYRVLPASSGVEALELRRSHPGPIDLVVTDMLMPGMSGEAMVDCLLRGQEELRVIYISGYSEEAGPPRQAERVLALFLAKPFTMAELLQHVQVLLA